MTTLGWYEAAMACACLISVAMMVVAVYNWDRPGAPSLAGILCGAALWSGAALGRDLAAEPGLALLFNKVLYLGTVTVVFFYAIFALTFTGRDDLVTRRLVALLLVEPVLLMVAVWTGPTGGGVFRHVQEGATVYATGPAFHVHTAYSYTLIAVATVVLVRAAVLTNRLYQGQFAAVVVGVFAPVMSNVLYIYGPLTVDPTPVAFAVSGIALLFAIRRFGFIDIAPVARALVVDTIDQAMFVVGREGRFIDVNPAFEDVFDVENVVGDHVDDVLADYPTLREIAESSEQSDVVTVETAAETRHLEVTTTAVRDERDRFLGRLVLLHDVTERQRRRRELERQNEQLDQFASLVSHDLRNPLNVAMTRTDLAMQTGDSDHLEDVQDAHTRMDQLIDDVLMLARQGETVDETRPVALESVAHEAWHSVETDDATLDVDDPGTAVAAAGPLTRLFENLYRNAVEHGGQAVTVRVGPLDDGTGFYVADDGPGISEDKRGAVFEAGHTADSNGTGLGLAIVSQIAEAHDWTVDVTESVDGGARFEFADVDRPADRQTVRNW